MTSSTLAVAAPAAEIDFEQLKAAATEASNLLKLLSHPDRLLLLCQLVQGEACVQELETLTGIKQPSLSQQLGKLRDNDLVATRREGRQIYYSIASEDAMAVMEVLYQRFCGPAKEA
jgi:DNA-binding transcriptional ArsR family regulator